MSLATEAPAEAAAPSSTWTWAAFVVALVLLGGSLFLSIGLGLKACPLCYYQRTFVMGVVGVLAIGLLTGAWRTTNLPLLAMPACAGGLTIALWHVLLEQQVMECPAGILGLGTVPQQSLAGFIILEVVLGLAVLKDRPAGDWRVGGAIAGIVLGVAMAWGGVKSMAPIPPPSDEEYKQPPIICRPMRSGSSGR